MPTDRPPVIFVADTAATQTGALRPALERRYGADYDVVMTDAAPAATLDELSSAGREVALVLATEAHAEGTDLFAHARRLFPDCRRALLIEWGDWGEVGTAQRIFDLVAQLHIDYYVVAPDAPADEGFHLAITDLLRDWRSASGRRAGFTVIGDTASPRTHAIRALLTRAGVAAALIDADDEAAAAVLRDGGHEYAGAPLVRTLDGRVLVDPDDAELARSFGLATEIPSHTVDVAIVGAGPGGLAAAVYAASEGLSTLVLERESVGGQAGSSSLIRNYLGFPRGVSGAELAGRSYQQAWVFGARFAHTQVVTGLELGDEFALTTADGTVHARAVVLATGVSYRRLRIPALAAFVGASVFYGASAIEARAQRGRSAWVVGGGNSAGQAALHLAGYAASVHLLVRGPSLAASMSSYLIAQLEAAGVEIVTDSKVTDAAAGADGRMTQIELAHLPTGARRQVACDALFITIGARPHTEWLPDAVLRDQWGYVFTGASEADEDAPEPWAGRERPASLETSVPGLFAVGDVRRSSIKRVANAVGEGSVVISAVHRHLSRQA